MLKIWIIYVLFALYLPEIFGLSDEMQELVDHLHKTCVAETGAAEDQITAARQGNFAEDENFKCYIKCIFEQMGCLAEDGTVDVDAVVALMPPEIADKVEPTIRKCNEVGSNPCETSWLAHKCYQKGDPESYFLP